MSYIKINAPLETGFGTVLSEPALTFIAKLHDEFAGTICDVLRTRRARAAEMNGGTLPVSSPRPHASAPTVPGRLPDPPAPRPRRPPRGAHRPGHRR